MENTPLIGPNEIVIIFVFVVLIIFVVALAVILVKRFTKK